MKIFLSGKMDREHGAWRDEFLGTYWNGIVKRQLPKWVFGQLTPEWSRVFEHGIAPWPATLKAVLERYDYVGPYRQEDFEDDDLSNQGVFHGTTSYGAHGDMDPSLRAVVVQRCQEGIRKADLVFAFLNTPDCFGTLVEIGYAVALGKYVVVCATDDAEWDWDDYWFAGAVATSQVYPLWREEGHVPEADQARRALEQGILNYVEAGSPGSALTVPPRLSLVPQLHTVALQSFAQIARWSSDPRVREEATRMVYRLQAGGDQTAHR